eukprot:2918171-Rhodomonas_salina.1
MRKQEKDWDPDWRKGITLPRISKFLKEQTGAVRLGFDATKICERLEFGWTIWGLIGFKGYAKYDEDQVLKDYYTVHSDEKTIGKFVQRPEYITDAEQDILSAHLTVCDEFFSA